MFDVGKPQLTGMPASSSGARAPPGGFNVDEEGTVYVQDKGKRSIPSMKYPTPSNYVEWLEILRAHAMHYLIYAPKSEELTAAATFWLDLAPDTKVHIDHTSMNFVPVGLTFLT